MLLTIIIPFKNRIADVSERINELESFDKKINLVLVDDGSDEISKCKLKQLNLERFVTVTLPKNIGRMNAIKTQSPLPLLPTTINPVI